MLFFQSDKRSEITFISGCCDKDHPCFRMIYVSRIDFLTTLQLNIFSEILQPALMNNQRDGVDSFLLFTNGICFQYLEGSEEALTNIKNRLLMDKRHEYIKLLSFKRIEKRRLTYSPLWFVWLNKSELKKLMHSLSLSFNPYEWSEAEQLKVADALIASKQKYQNQGLKSLLRIRLNALLIGDPTNKIQHRLNYVLLFLISTIFMIVLWLCIYLYRLV